MSELTSAEARGLRLQCVEMTLQAWPGETRVEHILAAAARLARWIDEGGTPASPSRAEGGGDTAGGRPVAIVTPAEAAGFLAPAPLIERTTSTATFTPEQEARLREIVREEIDAFARAAADAIGPSSLDRYLPSAEASAEGDR